MQIGRVYTIRSHLRPDLVYYGSTKETLSRRLSQHTSKYRDFQVGKGCFYTSFDVIEIGDAYIELVELVEYTEKSQLHAVEGRHIRENECVNKIVPGRSPEEKRGVQKAANAKHYVGHKEELTARHAKYNADHRDEILKAQKIYRDAHFEQRHAQSTCECGGHFLVIGKSKQLRTSKHLAWMAK